MYLELVKQVAGVHQSLSEIDYDLSALQSMVSGLVSYASIFMVVIDQTQQKECSEEKIFIQEAVIPFFFFFHESVLILISFLLLTEWEDMYDGGEAGKTASGFLFYMKYFNHAELRNF